MNNAIKGIAREPSTAIGLGLVALALEDFQHGITPTACIKFLAGVAGIFMRENTDSLQAIQGTRSTSVEVSASVKKEESNGKNTSSN